MNFLLLLLLIWYVLEQINQIIIIIIIIIVYEVRVQTIFENDLCWTDFCVHGNQCFAPNLKTETHFSVLISGILFCNIPLLVIKVLSKIVLGKRFT